jgi:RNA polymerase sigma factor (TIGR02999 family)
VNDVTRILSAIEMGDGKAAEELLPLVYDDLRKLAARRMAQEKPGQTLQATALVHEAYVRLIASANPSARWAGRGHFFAAAAEAMRRILVESARRKGRIRHGGDRRRIELHDHLAAVLPASDDLLALNEALARLESHDPVRAQVVKLRFFTGLPMPDVAESLGISLATAERYWTFARVWLYANLGGGVAGD